MHWGADYGMGFGGIFMVLFWALVLVGAMYFIKSLVGGSSQEKEQRESAKDVLKKRYARGEMSREKFEEAMAVLNQHE